MRLAGVLGIALHPVTPKLATAPPTASPVTKRRRNRSVGKGISVLSFMVYKPREN